MNQKYPGKKIDNTSSTFFEALENKIKQEKINKYCFRIRICDQLIELRFPSAQDADWTERNLVGQITQEEGEPAAVFQFWTADCTRYVGLENASKKWKHKDESGYMECVPGWWFMGMDLKKKTFYYCRSMINADNRPYGIIPLFYQWARTQDMLLLHGAVVGVNGRGVLLAAKSGGGKSTLSVSCLLAGMDFVSDDHFLVNAHGALQAFPLYKTVKLNQDIMARVKPDMRVIWIDHMRKDKKTLDASRYHFCEKLSIHAIVWPKIINGNKPQITRMESREALNDLVGSTLQQIGIFHNSEAAQAIIIRLHNLPVYEIQLCNQLSANVEALRKFIEEI